MTYKTRQWCIRSKRGVTDNVPLQALADPDDELENVTVKMRVLLVGLRSGEGKDFEDSHGQGGLKALVPLVVVIK